MQGQLARGYEDWTQIGGDHAIKLLNRKLSKRFEKANPDVIHQHIYIAHHLEGLLQASFEPLSIRNIQLKKTSPSLYLSLSPEFGIKVTKDHFIPLPPESLDNSLSNAVGTARNKHTLFHGFKIFSQR